MPRTGRAVLPGYPRHIFSADITDKSFSPKDRRIGKRAQAAGHGRNMNPCAFLREKLSLTPQ